MLVESGSSFLMKAFIVSMCLTFIFPILLVLSWIIILSLVLGKRFTSYFISFLLDGFMTRIDNQFSQIRSELLKNIKGEVMDFGSGSGIYLKYTVKDAVTSGMLWSTDTQSQSTSHLTSYV
jgi:hypothetical protein